MTRRATYYAFPYPLAHQLAAHDFARSADPETRRVTYSRTSGLFHVAVSWETESGEAPRLDVGIRDRGGVIPTGARPFPPPKNRAEVVREALHFVASVEPCWGFAGD